MKKILSLLLIVCTLFFLYACGERSLPPVNVIGDGTQSATKSAGLKDPDKSTIRHHTTANESTEETETEFFSTDYFNAISYRDESGIIRAIGIVQVTNIFDESLYLSPCSIDFLDADGNTVHTADSVAAFPPIIAPGESAYFYEEIEPDLADVCNLTLSPILPYPVPADAVRYDVGEITVNDSPYGGLIVNGTVTNATEQPGEVVCVAAVLFDEAGTPLAVVQNVLMEPLAAGETKNFIIEDFLLPADWTADSIASVQAFAYPL